MEGPVKYLAKWNGVFYADPFLSKLLNKEVLFIKEKVIETPDPEGGKEKRIYNKHIDYNNQYHQHIREKQAQGDTSKDC